jgi:histidyl-tRNA synthetase
MASDRIAVIPIGADSFLLGFRVAERLREEGIVATLEITGRSPKAALSRAVKENCRHAAMIGDRERERGTVQLKDLSTGEQRELSIDELVETLETEGAERFAEQLLSEEGLDGAEPGSSADEGWEETGGDEEWH